MNNELAIPPIVESSTNAFEFARIWVADGNCQTSLRVGMCETHDVTALEEIELWGYALGAVVRQLGQAYRRYGVDDAQTVERLKTLFIDVLREVDPELTGRHHDEH